MGPKITQIAAASEHVFALTADGSVWVGMPSVTAEGREWDWEQLPEIPSESDF